MVSRNPRDKKILDTDSLQADVMRFMAIIAFCLIAILALVKNVEPPEPAMAAALPKVINRSAPAVSEKVEPEPAQVVPEKVEPEAAPEPPSLVLRFESDAIFLKLIHDERISLFARVGDQFYRLQPDFDLLPVTIKGDLYELLPASLPGKVRQAIHRKGEATMFLVGLPDPTMQQIEKLSGRYAGKGGVLLVGKKGEVSYVG